MSTQRAGDQFRTHVAKQTWGESLRLTEELCIDARQTSYLVVSDKLSSLKKSDKNCPKFEKTSIRVIPKDTLDAAQALEEARDIIGTRDTRPVCVLNFANAHVAGGGWKNGSGAQEEQIAYRSTLITTLPKRFYPMRPLDCIYSPTVLIFRENEAKGYSFMWNSTSPNLLPRVSVISLAAENIRGSGSVKNGKYTNQNTRILMMDKMRLILRTAATNRHSRLILGALGCGVFGHPPSEVATCWRNVLHEPEFDGWFETIIFAIFTPRSDPMNDENFRTFRSVLTGVNVGKK